jgi:hypothetical protein
MTDVRNVEAECHICGTKYQALDILSWNENLSGAMPENKSACPNCGAPFRKKVNPSIGTAKDVLMRIIGSKEDAAELLFDFSLNDSDIDEWKKIMLEMDYEEWGRNSEEFQKSLSDLSEEQINVFKKNEAIRKELEELKQKGKIREIIEEVANIAKEKIKEEKDKYISTK